VTLSTKDMLIRVPLGTLCI